MGEVMAWLQEALPPDAILTNGAGNYSAWPNLYYTYRRYGTQLGPTSGSMGYGLPAAVAAKAVHPERQVVCFAGDGCFLMTGQELATAVQYDLPIVIIVINNGMLGTIRMHQERHYPERVVATELRNPDFAAYARAFGAHGEVVERTEDFAPAFERALASGKPALLDLHVDPEALTPRSSLSAIRKAGLASAKG
jgi:acetolactate synthase-1/2/3 large subunit